MEKLHVYLSEIKKLEVSSGDELINSAEYYNIQPEFSTELENLQQNALEDLRRLPDEEIKRQLISIKHLERLFSKFDALYPHMVDKSQNGLLSAHELKLRAGALFNVIWLDQNDVSPGFIIAIYSSILSKHHSLTRFINKIEDMLAFERKNKMQVA
jgi:hypothetical protein